MTFPNISAETLDIALKNAKAEANAVLAIGKQDAFCGFATLHVKLRKNNKLAKVFLANGWRWDDYAKTFYLYPEGASQSMTLREDMMNAARRVLAQFNIPSWVEARAD